MQLINEAYFGKNKNLQQIEEIFNSIISDMKGNYAAQNISITLFTKNVAARMMKVESIIEKEFGFSMVGIQLIQAMPCINACTFNRPLHKQIIPIKVIRNSEGVRMVTQDMTMTIIMADALFYGKFTGGEITAILLHEIGHNFYSNNNYIYNVVSVSAAIMDSIKDPLSLIKGEAMLTIAPYVTKYLKKTPPMNQVALDIFSNGFKFFSLYKTAMFAKKLWDALQKGTLRIVDPILKLAQHTMHPINFVITLMGMDNEKFADNFATSYGYGVELSTGLSKMGTVRNLADLPIVTQIFEIVSLPGMIYAYFLDVHPNTYSRVCDQIEYCKREIKGITNPKTKKMIQMQIEEMEKVRDSFKKITVKGQLKNGKFISALFTFTYISMLKGKSLHDIVGTNKYKTDWEQLKSTKSIF